MASNASRLPIIDVSRINDPLAHLSISRELTVACSKWGFLLLKGHSIPEASIDYMFKLSKTFFDLPEDEKQPYSTSPLETGYIGSFCDRLKDDKMSMWFGGAPGSLREQTESLPLFWRSQTEAAEVFKQKCHVLFFATAHREDQSHGNSLRALMYPARGEKPTTGGSRMQPHTDSGSVTPLFQRAPGLEVLSPSGSWITAPCLDNHILVNLGDALSFWSGGQLKATLHRVTFEMLPFDRERQTMAYFGKAEAETVLQPLVRDEGVAIGEYWSNGVELFPGMTVGELSGKIMRGIYGSGEDGKEEL